MTIQQELYELHEESFLRLREAELEIALWAILKENKLGITNLEVTRSASRHFIDIVCIDFNRDGISDTIWLEFQIYGERSEIEIHNGDWTVRSKYFVWHKDPINKDEFEQYILNVYEFMT
jgi:hypothetical protein